MYSNAKEILVPFLPGMTLQGVDIRVPKIGDKKKLLDLSMRNARYYRLDRAKASAEKTPSRVEQLMTEMQVLLRLQHAPRWIECFDNSNIQGTNPVASCVVFKNGKPFKSEYRHFHIKTVQGANDFASMEEVIYRRYKRRVEEGARLPDLVVIDGGKGQLSAALASLERLALRGKVPIISIAKRLEEIYYPGDSVPLYIDKKSQTLKVLQHIRDEAHRFGITFHRQLRSKGFLHSELQDISGVGDKSIEALYSRFKNLESMKRCSVEKLSQVVSKSVAQKVYDYFRQGQ